MTEPTRYPLEKFEANSIKLQHEGDVLNGVELVLTTRFSNGKTQDVRFLVPADIAQSLAAQIAQAAGNGASLPTTGAAQVFQR